MVGMATSAAAPQAARRSDQNGLELVPRLVSIVVVNWNTRELLRRCLQSIAKPPGCDIETIVVDNASDDGSAELVRAEFPEVLLLVNERNVGFAAAVNRGVGAGRGQYALLLNSDARLGDSTLELLVDFAERQARAACVGGAVVGPDGRKHGAASSFPTLWSHFLTISGLGRRMMGEWYPSLNPHRVEEPREVDWVGGACMLIRRTAFDRVGGMDEVYFLYAEEMDLCYRLRRLGGEIWHQPLAHVVHEGGGSGSPPGYRKGELLYASQTLFFDRSYGPLAASLLKAETYGIILFQNAWRSMRRALSGGRYRRDGLSLRRIARVRRTARTALP
jgi:N-acetylglucosaminyl-diphospho-decaprenol L-rhamnosyltransferase